MKPGRMTVLACRALLDGPTAADVVGAKLWPNRTSKATSMGGGGDYAAQMLLGRLRKAGLARVVSGDGSSRWALTPNGQRVARMTVP